MPEAALRDQSDVLSIEARLCGWMVETVLPFWSEKGINPRTGLSFERFNADGTPDLAAPQRVRVQFRQVYVLSYAQVLGWLPKGGEMAARLWDQTMKTFWRGDENGFVHILSADGQIADGRCDSYDHAFAMLSLTWLARATGEQRYFDQINRLLRFVDRQLADRNGHLRESRPDRMPRRQNPQMHWFEAMLALHESVGHPEGLRRAARFRDFFETQLFDKASGTLGEYFTESWQPVEGLDGTIVEPGHMAEWTWLLRMHERRAGLHPSALASALLDKALLSADPETGLLVDETDRALKPLRATRRSWLQTELAKAWLAEAEIGRAGAGDEARQALHALERHYLGTPFTAGWVDQLDEACQPVPGFVPTSTLYHIIVAIAEADRILGEGRSRPDLAKWDANPLFRQGAAE